MVSLTYTTNEKVKKLLKEVNSKKVTRFGKILPKLVNLTAGVLAAPLSKTITNSIWRGVFPNKANISLVSPLDKKTPDKNYVSKFRPVSVIPTSSKILVKVIKSYLMKSMDNYFFLSFTIWYFYLILSSKNFYFFFVMCLFIISSMIIPCQILPRP